MQQLLPMKEHAPIHSAVLDSLDPVYDEMSGLAQWKTKFCLENFDVLSVTGSVSYLIQFFSNPRPLPVDYLPRARDADQQHLLCPTLSANFTKQPLVQELHAGLLYFA